MEKHPRAATHHKTIHIIERARLPAGTPLNNSPHYRGRLSSYPLSANSAPPLLLFSLLLFLLSCFFDPRDRSVLVLGHSFPSTKPFLSMETFAEVPQPALRIWIMFYLPLPAVWRVS